MGKREKRNKKQPDRPPVGVLDGVLAVAAVGLMVGMRTFAVVCTHDDGSPAACAMTGRVLFVAGLVAIALSLARLLSADRHTKRSFDFLVAVVGLLVAALPGTMLPLCADATMRCHTITTPFARVMGVALIVLSIACELTIDREVPTGRKRRR